MSLHFNLKSFAAKALMKKTMMEHNIPPENMSPHLMMAVHSRALKTLNPKIQNIETKKKEWYYEIEKLFSQTMMHMDDFYDETKYVCHLGSTIRK